MDIEQFRIYCLSKKAVTESFPFDETTLVFKVMGKMFAICGLDEINLRVNLKCDPEYALELRDQYDGVIAGFHMNKKHWNSIYLDSDLPEELMIELIDHSYDLIVENLSKKVRNEYDAL